MFPVIQRRNIDRGTSSALGIAQRTDPSTAALTALMANQRSMSSLDNYNNLNAHSFQELINSQGNKVGVSRYRRPMPTSLTQQHSVNNIQNVMNMAKNLSKHPSMHQSRDNLL